MYRETPGTRSLSREIQQSSGCACRHTIRD